MMSSNRWLIRQNPVGPTSKYHSKMESPAWTEKHCLTSSAPHLWELKPSPMEGPDVNLQSYVYKAINYIPEIVKAN